MECVTLKDRKVGDGHETVFLAEIGSIFNHSKDEAKRLIKAAADANVDFLKGEILHSPDFSLDDEYVFSYQCGPEEKTKSESHREIVKRKVNPLDFYRDIFEYSRKLGLEFIVSVYDLESIYFLEDIQPAAVKIASSNINHEPLIQVASEAGFPLIFDAGNTYLGEVGRAITWTNKYKAPGVIIQHHPGSGPALAETHNLKIMQTYKEAFKTPVGLSCHYIGDEMLYTAIGMGANTLEKPISFDPKKEDIDTVFSLHIEDLPKVVQKIKNSWKAIGTAPLPLKPDRNLDQRMGLVASNSLEVGDNIDFENIRFALPCRGISVEHWSVVKNKKINTSLQEGTPINWSDIDFGAHNP